MIYTTFAPNDPHPAAHYNGVQQTLDGARRVLAALMSQYGYAGSAVNNGTVQEVTVPNATEVTVKGPALYLIGLTAPTLQGAESFTKAADENLPVPALNTVTGQSRNDLVIAKINVGQVNTYLYDVVQGTPATTGSQVDPAIPDNAIKLARITRAHGHGSIVNANITDLRVAAKVALAHQA